MKRRCVHVSTCPPRRRRPRKSITGEGRETRGRLSSRVGCPELRMEARLNEIAFASKSLIALDKYMGQEPPTEQQLTKIGFMISFSFPFFALLAGKIPKILHVLGLGKIGRILNIFVSSKSSVVSGKALALTQSITGSLDDCTVQT
ncbi:hypothetical protein NDU88_001620 [Pleurodeles waltl]|uniref:Uncharacterized protein n=1 Tax=Pleurodeles waltl TaxID=8319 RepID=A0AAV7Q7E0_PLEWA|nr:hypothetical protein NDU88_001620 [Pleurodeles waltl]